MTDSSHMAPDLHDIQMSNASKENHVSQNQINIDEHHASSIEKENLPELPSSEGGGMKSPLQQNGYHAEMEECQTYSGRFKPLSESEAAYTSSLDKNGLTSLSSHEAREKDSNGRDSSLLPVNSQESMQEVPMEGISALAPTKISHEGPQIDMSSLDKNGSISLSSHEARVEDSNGRDCSLLAANSQEGMQEVTMEERGPLAPTNISHDDPAVNRGHPCSFDSSNVVLMGDTVQDEKRISSNASNDNIIRGDEDVVPSKVLNGSEKAEESYLKEKKDGVGKETESLDESLTRSLTPPCISTEISLENNVQPPPFHSVSESGQHENEFTKEPGGDLEAIALTSDVHNVLQNEVNAKKGEWPDQGVTMVISNDLEGWQRFDTEEGSTTMDHTQGSDQRFALWEKLLDDGFDGSEREIVNPPLQLALAPSPFEENEFELASPGNPFIEGLGRVSSFSEADGFAQNRDLPSSGLSKSFEESSSFRYREGQFYNASGNDDISAVLAPVDGEANTVQLESINEHGRSTKPLSSFDAMEPFEAPSFMSLVDPKSHALFEASMPTFQASNTGHGQDNGGEKWVANFDLMAPSTQEITRSSSMPRSGGEASGQRPGQSFSFATSREQEPSKKESDSPQAPRTKSVFLSPKFSPVVQKVVDKVRTTPAVANGVLNSVRQAMSPKTSDKKSTSKSLLTRCICW